jgi:hypothetical protein
MTTSLDRQPLRPGASATRSMRVTDSAAGRPPAPVRLARRHAVLALAVVAVGLRLPLLGHAPSADEGGFLAVAGQWHAGGTSLYGNYWVDRPPLLITIFRLASQAGGLVPLRLIGCLATVLVILGVAHVARRLGGPHAAGWAALAAAIWCTSPLLGAEAVNGELLSAPFVIWGIAAMIRALGIDVGERETRHALLFAAGAGAALAAALLIKQNMADVGVFAVVATTIAWRRGEISGMQARRLGAAFAAGGGLTVVVVSGWTLLHGTSPADVFGAMYPFRIEAGRVMAASNANGPAARLHVLLASWVLSGGAVIMAVAAWALVTRRLRGTAVWALGATAAFAAVSVLMGGNFWGHYLIQLVAPLSVLIGVLAARKRLGARVLLTAAALVAAVVWPVALPWQGTSVGSSVGHAIGSAARPDDTIITVYGHADVTQSSGLVSPYPYLWSLPIKTLDPDLRLLNSVLSGPSAPTWFVTWRHVSNWGVDSTTTSRLLARDYHPVAVLEGRTVYLHNGIHRRTPVLGSEQPATPPVITTGLKELFR